MENQTDNKSEATTATHNNQPKGDAPDLSAVPLDALFIELHRRRAECVAFVITPQDVADYWECDDSGATHPGSRMPSADAWKAMRKAFERWMDCGGHSDVQQVMREEWIEADPESFADDQEGGCA